MQTAKILIRAPEGIPPRMVKDYVGRCHTALQGAAAALDHSDYGQLVVFGHRLKGSGGAYGMPALTVIGSAIEDAARRANLNELRQKVVDLEQYLELVEIASN